MSQTADATRTVEASQSPNARQVVDAIQDRTAHQTADARHPADANPIAAVSRVVSASRAAHGNRACRANRAVHATRAADEHLAREPTVHEPRPSPGIRRAYRDGARHAASHGVARPGPSAARRRAEAVAAASPSAGHRSAVANQSRAGRCLVVAACAPCVRDPGLSRRGRGFSDRRAFRQGATPPSDVRAARLCCAAPSRTARASPTVCREQSSEGRRRCSCDATD